VRNPTGSSATLLLDNQSRSPEVPMSTMDVPIDHQVLQGELAIISVYCPDELQKFQEFKDRLETAEMAR